MPPYRQPPSWRLEGGGQILDLETAVKDGILGGVGGGGGLGCGEKVDLKQMIEELEPVEDVPTVFICTISLEPMVDPVTLCTGQTYERSNILKWLSMGHFTCPTTMQELWEDAVTPNHTLHQLIHAWFSQRYLRFKKRSPPPPSSQFLLPLLHRPPSSVTPSSTPTFPSSSSSTPTFPSFAHPPR